jgi:hypothetical protein
MQQFHRGYVCQHKIPIVRLSRLSSTQKATDPEVSPLSQCGELAKLTETIILEPGAFFSEGERSTFIKSSFFLIAPNTSRHHACHQASIPSSEQMPTRSLPLRSLFCDTITF